MKLKCKRCDGKTDHTMRQELKKRTLATMPGSKKPPLSVRGYIMVCSICGGIYGEK